MYTLYEVARLVNFDYDYYKNIYNVFKYNVIEDKWNNKYKYVGYKLIKIHSVEIKKMLTHKI